MPDNIGAIFNFVCKIPVINPARHPEIKAINKASKTGTLLITNITVIAAPVAKDPSTVKSEKSNKRYEIYKPSAIIPQIIP